MGPRPKINLDEDTTIVAGHHTFAELTQCRHDVAHWWKGSMDGIYLTDMFRTLNELILRKYPQPIEAET